MQDIAKHVRVALLAELKKHRQERDLITAPELIALTRKAAGLALSGKRFSTDDRVEVAGRIMLVGLTELAGRLGPGALPKRDDRAHGFTAYYRRAGRERDRIDAERAGLATGETAELAAGEVPASDTHTETEQLLGGAVPLVRGGAMSANHARALARETAEQLGLGHDENVYALIYGAARDVPAGGDPNHESQAEVSRERVADELGLTVSAYVSRCRRGADRLTKRYPTAADFTDALGVGTPLIGKLPDGTTEIRFTVPGRPWPTMAKRENMTKRTKALGQPTREQRERGPRIERPDRELTRDEQANQARLLTGAYTLLAARNTHTQPDPHAGPTITADEARADALTALGHALRYAR